MTSVSNAATCNNINSNVSTSTYNAAKIAQNNAQRLKSLITRYMDAKKAGPNLGYDIALAEEDNYEHYYVLLQPKVGVYQGQSYILELKTTYGHGSDVSQYPINPPYLHFVTDVYHVNVSPSGGAICVDILKDKAKWMPTYDFVAIMLNVLVLFDQPNNASPYNGDASKHWMICEKDFMEKKATVSHMSTSNEEKMHNMYFAPFIQQVREHAKKNNLRPYKKYFPQLFPNDSDYETLSEKLDDEFTAITIYFESLSVSKRCKKIKDEVKDKSAAVKDKSAAVKDNSTESKDNSTESKDNSTESSQEKTVNASQENISQSQQTKKTRWSKYQKQ